MGGSIQYLLEWEDGSSALKASQEAVDGHFNPGKLSSDPYFSFGENTVEKVLGQRILEQMNRGSSGLSEPVPVGLQKYSSVPIHSTNIIQRDTYDIKEHASCMTFNRRKNTFFQWILNLMLCISFLSCWLSMKRERKRGDSKQGIPSVSNLA